MMFGFYLDERIKEWHKSIEDNLQIKSVLLDIILFANIKL
jgi:hypothetical protein